MKGLYIRNTVGGMIWQSYAVRNETEVEMLRKTALANGYLSVTLDPTPPDEETFPNWRDSESWKARIKDVVQAPDFPET
jgi:hypothetical protein